MGPIDTEYLLIFLSGLVVLSYFFSFVSRFIKIPSVLLLLFAGIGFKLLASHYNFTLRLPSSLIEGLGVVGIIMIILEAGLDLKLEKNKIKNIRDSFLSALIILILSTAGITTILYLWLDENILKCIVYALPLSIMSSSIVIPSIHHLTEQKKEFLIYEASFSDILGIIFFNYFTAGEIFTIRSTGAFGFSIIASVVLSVIISLALLFFLSKTKMNIKFFLVFSLLILIYSGGKLLHLPSLIIILAFGLLINNWEKVPLHKMDKFVTDAQVESLRSYLHSITAETSFLIRTFFFLLFGFSINLGSINNQAVIVVGSLIVGVLFLVRFVYLKYSFKTNVFPETFFIPRGLITIVLFYKIPFTLKLTTFNDGILFFVILSTSVLLAIAMIAYKKQNDEVTEDPVFSERKDIL